MSKPWNRSRRISRTRATETLNVREKILILCEGKKTEPLYFDAFPVVTEIVEIDVMGEGMNTSSLVEEAIKLRQTAIDNGTPYNQIWCVFDRDSFPSSNFNNAFKIAMKNQLKIAYSNQCFELWYYLHFHYTDSALHRSQYASKLTRCMGKKYKKNDSNMYNHLKDRQDIAIKNATKLMSKYKTCNPEKDNPSTNVHLLVRALNEFL